MSLATSPRASDVWSDPESPYIGVDHRDPKRLVGVNPGLLALGKAVQEEQKDSSIPASRQHETLEEEFSRLVREWRSETAILSSVRDIAMHPSYQKIIGLSHDAVPLLLRDLALQPDHWFWALKAITGVDPVPPSDRGDVRKMTDAWLKWGREQGYELT